VFISKEILERHPSSQERRKSYAALHKAPVNQARMSKIPMPGAAFATNYLNVLLTSAHLMLFIKLPACWCCIGSI
jgi:hypothetical protein